MYCSFRIYSYLHGGLLKYEQQSWLLSYVELWNKDIFRKDDLSIHINSISFLKVYEIQMSLVQFLIFWFLTNIEKQKLSFLVTFWFYDSYKTIWNFIWGHINVTLNDCSHEEGPLFQATLSHTNKCSRSSQRWMYCFDGDKSFRWLLWLRTAYCT